GPDGGGVTDVRLSVSLAGPGSGRVTTTPAGIDCPGRCEAAFPAGSAVALEAAPAAGSSFVGWGGSCRGPGRCTVSESGTVSATFGPPPAASLSVVPVAAQVPGIRLNPGLMRIFIRQWVRFEARRNGLAEPRVSWSVREGDAGGAIVPDGTYTAPAQVGL